MSWTLEVYDGDKLIDVVDCPSGDNAKTKAKRMRTGEFGIATNMRFHIFDPNGLLIWKSKVNCGWRMNWEWIPR